MAPAHLAWAADGQMTASAPTQPVAPPFIQPAQRPTIAVTPQAPERTSRIPIAEQWHPAARLQRLEEAYALLTYRLAFQQQQLQQILDHNQQADQRDDAIQHQLTEVARALTAQAAQFQTHDTRIRGLAIANSAALARDTAMEFALRRMDEDVMAASAALNRHLTEGDSPRRAAAEPAPISLGAASRLNLAITQLQLRRPREAAQLLEEVVRLQPHDVEARLLIARVYRDQLGQSRNAITHYEVYRWLDPRALPTAAWLAQPPADLTLQLRRPH